MIQASRLASARMRALVRGRLFQGRLPVVSGGIIAAIVLVAVFAPLLEPHPSTFGKLSDAFVPPVWMADGDATYPLGTDDLGRDILSRVISGARISLIVSVAAIFLAGTMGSALGIIAGYLGGWVGTVVMRMVDAFLALPSILVALVLVVVLRPGVQTVIIVIALLLWARYARQVRGETLSVKEQDFVTVARALGASDVRIMVRHIFPNVFNTIIVLATLQVGYVILLESSLSFLGLGVPPPQASWGQMIAGGRSFLILAWWITVVPGAALLVTVLSMNMFGDWLRDRLDPVRRDT